MAWWRHSLCILLDGFSWIKDLPGVMDTLKTTRAQLIVLKNDGGSSSCVGVSCASPSVPSEELSSSPCQVSYSRPKQDMVTYYLNLTYANNESPRWEKEYRLTESFLVPDGSPRSMHDVLKKISTETCFLQKYYEYNSVSYDLENCDDYCKTGHVCAIREVDFTKYAKCLKDGNVALKPAYHIIVMLAVLLMYVLNYK